MSEARRIDLQIARHLSDAALTGTSGIVTCVRGKLRRLFCVVDGRLALAVSNVIEEQLIETIARLGHLDPQGKRAVIRAAAADGLGPGAYLAQHASLSEQALADSAAVHLRTLLGSTLEWTGGTAQFAAGRSDTRGEPTTALEPIGLIVEHALSIKDLGRARNGVGPADARPVAVEAALDLADRLPDDPTVQYLINACDGTREASTMIAASPSEPDRTWRTLYALILIGALELSRHRRADKAAADALVSRGELEARVVRAEQADYYAVLEVNSYATPDEVREAYYFLARRFHPDRFRSGHLGDMMPRIESYFARVTEAYNNLSDSDLRAEYDERRAADVTEDKADQDTGYLARQNFLRAKALIQRGRFTDAVTALENAIKLDEADAGYHLELGRLLAANPRHRQPAEEHLIRAADLDPSLVDTYIALGELYQKADRADEAVRCYRRALRWEPGHLEAAEQLKAMGQKVEASEDGGLLRGLFRS